MHTHRYIMHTQTHTREITGTLLGEMVNLEVSCSQFILDIPWQ